MQPLNRCSPPEDKEKIGFWLKGGQKSVSKNEEQGLLQVGVAIAKAYNAWFDSHRAAHDIFYEAVKNALTKDGWTITHDPLA